MRYQCQFWAAFQSKKCRGVATNFGCFFVDCDQFWPRFLNMCLILGLGCEPHLVVPLARFLGMPLGKKLIFFWFFCIFFEKIMVFLGMCVLWFGARGCECGCGWLSTVVAACGGGCGCDFGKEKTSFGNTAAWRLVTNVHSFRTTTLYMSLVGCAGVCSVGFGSATIFGHVRESQIRQISFEVLCVTVKTLIFACPKRVFFWSRRCAHFWPATFFGINFFCNMTLKTFNENINFFEKYKN